MLNPLIKVKTKLSLLVVLLALLSGVHSAAAQGARFFRISGPAATTITAVNPDGTLVWNNAQPGSTYTIQTTLSLGAGINWVDYIQIIPGNAVSTNLLIAFNPPPGMTLIPAGVFTMGDTLDGVPNAIPTVVASVSAIYMDVNLVSYDQWQSVYNWAITNGYSFTNAGTANDVNYPVQTVNWFDMVKWCNARSQQAGLTPVYYTIPFFIPAYVYTNGDTGTTVYPNWSANGYRLPTEAEWEKAARGGLSGQRFPWGNIIAGNLANYKGNTAAYSYDFGPDGYNAAFSGGSLPYTSPVGYFGANGYGLNDMSGNVWEWLWDWYGTPYAGGSDPNGPDYGSNRVLRGGSWHDYAFSARCANRNSNSPGSALSNIGFRCVKGL